MIDMERHFQAAHEPRIGVAPILVEYAVVLAIILIVGALALAEVSGVLNAFVHDISFTI